MEGRQLLEAEALPPSSPTSSSEQFPQARRRPYLARGCAPPSSPAGDLQPGRHHLRPRCTAPSRSSPNRQRFVALAFDLPPCSLGLAWWGAGVRLLGAPRPWGIEGGGGEDEDDAVDCFSEQEKDGGEVDLQRRGRGDLGGGEQLEARGRRPQPPACLYPDDLHGQGVLLVGDRS